MIVILVKRLFRRLKHWRQRHPQIGRDTVVGIVIFAFLVILAQILYPSDRLLPSIKAQGFEIGGQRLTKAQEALAKHYEKATITVVAGNKTFTQSLAQIGVEIDRTATVQKASEYSLYQRFIPFSSLAIMLHRDTPVAVLYDDERLVYFAQQISKDAYVPAVNAGVKVVSGNALLVPAKPSQAYPTEEVVRAIKHATFTPKTSVGLSAATKPAARTDSAVKNVLGEAQKAVNTPFTLTLNGENIVIDKATIGSWLDFADDPSHNLVLVLKTDVVKAYLGQIQSKVYKAPGTTKVQLIDGKEVSRTAGETGRGIDMDTTIARLQAVLHDSGNRVVEVPVVDLPPTVVYDRKRSNTDAGLAVLLSDIVKAKGDYGIAVMEINGRSGKVNGSKQYTAASTFKLFVAYGIFKEIEAGHMSWSDTIYSGKSVATCFDDMIVVSDNACAKAFGDTIGWSKIDTEMHNLGLTSTHVESGNHLTTASDLALFLYKLQDGTLVSSSDRSRLLDAMKRQIYRSGIPAGTGVAVADKVGFLDALLHDAAIVYGPKGPYVLVIMSNHSSWSQLADAARQINNFLKQ